MNSKHVPPGNVHGIVAAPASKSDSQRAIAAASLAAATTRIENYQPCADSEAALEIVRVLGAEVAAAEGCLDITGGRHPAGDRLDCGESGLCLRLFAAITALRSHETTLSAQGSLCRRPVTMLEEVLPRLGASCRTQNGLPPVRVRGPLRSGRVHADGSGSSQHISGLLFALPLAAGDSEIRVAAPASKPYLRMTLATLSRFGIDIASNANLTLLAIKGGQAYRPCCYEVEGDWSAAAFMLVAGAISGEVTVRNLKSDSPQADRAILEVLAACGAEVAEDAGGITVRRGDLRAFEFDAGDAPDLFPPLAALASRCRGTSRIWGSERLKHKESDRAEALAAGFAGIGVRIQAGKNWLEISGGAIRGGEMDSRGDHRIAMAAALAGLASAEGVRIHDPACVAKSYPRFWDDLESLAGRRP